MSQWDFQLISSIVRTKRLQHAINKGISASSFGSHEAQIVFEFLSDFASRPEHYGEVASEKLLLERFPTIPFPEPVQGIDALVLLIKRDFLHRTLAGHLEQVSALLEEDPEAALAAYTDSSKLFAETIKSDDVDLTLNIKDRIEEEYGKIKNGGGVGLWPWPWPELTDGIGMIEAGTLNVFWGVPKSGKCVVEGERIDQIDGSRVAIEDLPELCVVPSHTKSTGRIRWASARRVYSGVKDCVEVLTESGLRLRTSTEHLYMVPGGYARIKDLSVGDYVATARKIPDHTGNRLSVEDAHFLGLLVGDGNYTRGEVQFTNEDTSVVAAIKEHCERHACLLNQGSRDIEYRIATPRGKANPVLDWLRDLEMHGLKSVDKKIPGAVWESGKEALAAFLAGLLDTDGGVTDSGTKASRAASWGTSSRELARDIQHALTRLGIRGCIQQKKTNLGTVSFEVLVYSKQQHMRLLALLGQFITHEKKLSDLTVLADGGAFTKRNKDAVPFTEELDALIAAEKGAKPYPRRGKSKTGHAHLFRRTNRISRDFLHKLADAWDSDPLRMVAEEEIVWEKIRDIAHIGKKDCYDVCITDGLDPNFVVEDFIVHNTWIAMFVVAMAFLHFRRRIIVYSPEMRREQLERRLACILGQIDYEGYRKGTLTESDWTRFMQILQYVQDMAQDVTTHERIIFLNGLGKTKASNTVRDLRHKVEQYSPDLIFMDSAYHAAGGVDWKLITDLSRGVKKLSNDTGIPSIAVIQENERMKALSGGKDRGVASIAMGPSWAQDFDTGFRIINTGDDHVLVQTAANREAKTAGKGIRIRFKPGGVFDFVDYNVKEVEEPQQAQQFGAKSRLPVGKLLSKPTYG